MKNLIFFILLFISFSVFSQEKKKIDITEYIKEVQIWNKEGSKMALTFWIPTSYWRLALEGSPNVTEESIQLIEQTFEAYLFVCVLELTMDAGAEMTFKEESQIRKGLYARAHGNKVLLPLKDKDIPETTLYFMETMKPMFEQMLGQMGKGMHFYLFDNQDKNGNMLVDEYEKGSLIIKHSDHEFNFELPLVILLPDKFCPTDNAVMKGNWNFCPMHGVKLD